MVIEMAEAIGSSARAQRQRRENDDNGNGAMAPTGQQQYSRYLFEVGHNRPPYSNKYRKSTYLFEVGHK